MTPSYVLDASTLIALFDAYPPVKDVWDLADDGEALLLFPAVAVAETNRLIGASDAAWATLLWPETVNIIPLDSFDAAACGRQVESIAACHAIAVARSVQGLIVTRTPWQYPEGVAPIRAV